MGEANQPKYKCFKSTDGAWACGAERVAQETSQMVEEKWLLDPKNAQMLNNNNFNVTAAIVDAVCCHNPDHDGGEISVAATVYSPESSPNLPDKLEYTVDMVHQGLVEVLLTPAGMALIKDFNVRRVETEDLVVYARRLPLTTTALYAV
jgi:hypothetical protein